LGGTSNYLGVTAALQQHVELRTGGTVQTYLTDNSILVTADFAEVSKDAGFDIDAFIAP
jgi:hypothetical protein